MKKQLSNRDNDTLLSHSAQELFDYGYVAAVGYLAMQHANDHDRKYMTAGALQLLVSGWCGHHVPLAAIQYAVMHQSKFSHQHNGARIRLPRRLLWPDCGQPVPAHVLRHYKGRYNQQGEIELFDRDFIANNWKWFASDNAALDAMWTRIEAEKQAYGI